MKITIKDLKQQKFTLDAEPSQTIAHVKEAISKEKGWDVSLQKLIYSGKVLQDSQTVESYNISEKGFVVCMVTKPKAPPPAPKPPAAPSTPAVSSTPAQPPAPAVAAAVPASTTTNAAPATPSPTAAGEATDRTFNDPSSLAMGRQREDAIQNMEAMGFPRPDIERAMRAAFYNADRAVEFLLNGIPENIQQEQRQPAQQAPATPAAAADATPAAGATPATAAAPTEGDAPINLFEAAAQAGRGAGAGGRGGGGNRDLAAAAAAAGAAGAGGGNSLEFLRNNPQFQQLRQVVQQQPSMLEPILQNVGAGNPQLAQLITNNLEQFLQMLSEDADDDAPLPPGAQAINVTEEEREAIERLCRLGFERDLVIQAYFACDKNEELAANFLFDQPEDEDAGN
ncbi:MAG: hypothetical protein M1814_006132 [Vezdaea aestivalis]|nr:MAG: hypothetical protein M1814_006132 [Vezdaea aestivalis]